MSIQTGANTISNENISVQLHDREEFIEEFLRQKGYQNTSYISIPQAGMNYPRRQRWNYLYNFDRKRKTYWVCFWNDWNHIGFNFGVYAFFVGQLYTACALFFPNGNNRVNHLE